MTLSPRKRKEAKVEVATASDDTRGPTRERLRHARGHVEVGGDARQKTIRRTMRDYPIARALKRGAITQAQHDAGMKYLHHWHAGGLSSGISSADLNRVFASDPTNFSGMAKTESQYFHRQRLRHAQDIVGVTASCVLHLVICEELSFEDIGYRLGYQSKPHGIEAVEKFVRESLQQLAKEWGL